MGPPISTSESTGLKVAWPGLLEERDVDGERYVGPAVVSDIMIGLDVAHPVVAVWICQVGGHIAIVGGTERAKPREPEENKS
jgi:hypothetical protein